MKRTPIRRVSKKRAVQLRTYSQKRKAYLAKKPWCEIFCKRFGIPYATLYPTNGAYCETTAGGMRHWKMVPLATDIHHVDGRTGERLNNDFKWLSASRAMHIWVHDHPSEARAIGVLE